MYGWKIWKYSQLSLNPKPKLGLNSAEMFYMTYPHIFPSSSGYQQKMSPDLLLLIRLGVLVDSFCPKQTIKYYTCFILALHMQMWLSGYTEQQNWWTLDYIGSVDFPRNRDWVLTILKKDGVQSLSRTNVHWKAGLWLLKITKPMYLKKYNTNNRTTVAGLKK